MQAGFGMKNGSLCSGACRRGAPPPSTRPSRPTARSPRPHTASRLRSPSESTAAGRRESTAAGPPTAKLTAAGQRELIDRSGAGRVDRSGGGGVDRSGERWKLLRSARLFRPTAKCSQNQTLAFYTFVTNIALLSKSQHRDRTHARTDTQRQTHQAHETADTPTADTHTSESQPRPKHTQPPAPPNRNPP